MFPVKPPRDQSLRHPGDWRPVSRHTEMCGCTGNVANKRMSRVSVSGIWAWGACSSRHPSQGPKASRPGCISLCKKDRSGPTRWCGMPGPELG